MINILPAKETLWTHYADSTADLDCENETMYKEAENWDEYDLGFVWDIPTYNMITPIYGPAWKW